MKLSELIAAYGDDKVQFQNLDQCATALDMKGATTKITFGTEQRLDPNGTEMLGLVVWMDRNRVAEITSGTKARTENHPSPTLQEGAEAMDRDIGILLATIDFLAEATGEGPEEEDAALVSQIRSDHEKRRALPLTEGEK